MSDQQPPPFDENRPTPPQHSSNPPEPPNFPPSPPTGHAYAPYPSHDPQMQQAADKNFFAALFDFGFSTFVTPMIVKFVYVLATIGLALGYFIFVVVAFAESAAYGVIILLLGAVAALIYLAFIRMTLEFYYAIVRMSQDINRRLPKA